MSAQRGTVKGDNSVRFELFGIVVLLSAAMSFASVSCQSDLENNLTPGRGLLNSAQIDTLYKYSRIFPNGTQFSIAFINHDSAKYVGVEKRNDTLRYVRNYDKIFEIGSITKTFTGTVLAKLVLEGRVRLNEPIKDLLPIKLHQSSLDGVEITLVDLANHTSGLPRVPDNLSTDYSIPGSPYQYYGRKELYDFLSNRLVLKSVPGRKKLYSNLGAGLLGYILTLITKESYEEMIDKSICEPLGMNSTFVELKDKYMSRLVRGRDPSGKIVKNWDLNILTGAGGVKSTAPDLVKYVQASIKDTSSFYNLALQPTFRVNAKQMECLGWAIYKLGNEELYPAFGATAGYCSGIIFDKKTKTGVILLSNVSGFLSAKGDYVSSICRSLYSTEFPDR